MAREPEHRYLDPLDEIWLATARKLGLRVQRGDAAYASYDGRGTLSIATRAELDADDSLAQIIFHELCHALISGPNALSSPDWGMCNETERDLVREHACHRLQAALAQRHGLREFFAVTTDHRPYWDALPADPLTGGDDPAIDLAQAAFARARGGAWGEAIDAALSATARIADAVRPFSDAPSLWNTARELHASGFPLHRDPTRTCRECAWSFAAGPGRPRPRCRMTRGGARTIALRVELDARACDRWEQRPREDPCGACGACCREGFDLVPVRARERLARTRPELLRADRHGLHVPRPGGRCVALEGDGGAERRYRCSVYADRPRACAEFEVFGDACLQARRRVGLSR
jgi:hypothetical protein